MPSAMYNLSKLVCLRALGKGCQVPEFELRPFLTLDASHVQLRHGKRDLVVHVLIENAHEYHRQRSEGEIDQYNVGIIEEIGAIEVVVDTVPEKSECPHKVLGGVSDNVG